MAAPQIVDLPQFFTLASGMVIRVTAVDPTSNATVAGVSISGVSIDVDTPDTPGLDPGFVALPAYTQGDLAA